MLACVLSPILIFVKTLGAAIGLRLEIDLGGCKLGSGSEFCAASKRGHQGLELGLSNYRKKGRRSKSESSGDGMARFWH